jgi:ABC-type transport system substrate-binding protein
MSLRHEISRRLFLRVGVGIAGVGLLAACAPATPATKPAETKPAADAKPATAPAAAAKPAAGASPAAAGKPGESKHGNRDLVPSPSSELSINGKAGTIEKVDETTVQFKFADPYPGFMDVMGGSTFIGSSQNQGDSYRGPVAPAHSLKQFLTKYGNQATIDAAAKAANFDNWVSSFKFKINWRLNNELPVLGPWKTATPINTPTWTLERNPFFYAVDTEGYRLRTDNGQRLRIELVTVGGSFVPFPKIGEMMVQQLKRIGIQLDSVEQERTLAERRRDGNEVQTVIWANDGSELIWAFPDHALPVRTTSWMGPEIGKWYQSSGAAGTKPEDPELLKALELFRGAFWAGGCGSTQGGSGHLEDHCRGGMDSWHRRPITGHYGCPYREEQHGEHPRAAVQRPAWPDALCVPAANVVLQEVAA